MNSNTVRASRYIKEAKKNKKSNDGNLANNYPPYDEVTRGDVIAGRLGKDRMGGKRKVSEALIGKQYRIDVNKNNEIDSEDLSLLRSRKKGKKSSVKEGYSNWREELIEVSEYIGKEQNSVKVVEKKVNNKIDINPTERTGDRLSGAVNECVERLGGTLLEMEEYTQECILEDLNSLELLAVTDELLEEVVYEIFVEALEEGYQLEEIENCILESIDNSFYLLTEEDSPRKRGVLSRLKGAVKTVGKGLARGAGYLAGLGARAVVRGAQEIGKGAERGYKGKPKEKETESRGPQVTQSASDRQDSEPKVQKSAKEGIRSGLRRSLSNKLYYLAHKVSPEHGKPSPGTKHAGKQRTAQPYRGVGITKRTTESGSREGSSVTSTGRPSSSPRSTDSSAKEQEARTKKFSTKVPSTSARAAYRQASSGVRSSLRQAALRRKQAAASAQTPPVEKTTTVPASKVTPRSSSRSGRSRSGGRGRTQGSSSSTSSRSRSAAPTSSTPNQSDSDKKRKAAQKALKNNPNISQSELQKIIDAAESYVPNNNQLIEKAESKQQQKLFGLALSVKRGETSRSKVSAEVLKLVDTMTEKQLRDFAKTKHEGLPKTKEEEMSEQLTLRMLAKIIEEAPNMPVTQQPQIKKPSSSQQSAINSALKAIQTNADSRKREAGALRRVAQTGGDISALAGG